MDFEKERKKAEEYAERQKFKQEIKEIKGRYKKTLPTHKLVTFYLFVVLNVVLLYSLIAMWYFQDLSNLGLIITDIAGQVLTFFIYSHHSTEENKQGSLKYDLTMKERDNENVG